MQRNSRSPTSDLVSFRHLLDIQVKLLGRQLDIGIPSFRGKKSHLEIGVMKCIDSI